MRPGMVRVNEDGCAIKLEIWRMPAQAFASFLALIPSPLGIGTIETASGKSVPGFICEQAGLLGATDITEFGGWRSYLASKADQRADNSLLRKDKIKNIWRIIIFKPIQRKERSFMEAQNAKSILFASNSTMPWVSFVTSLTLADTGSLPSIIGIRDASPARRNKVG